MPDLFHFKKFSLSDKNCAMKIGTDAVLLGTWTDTSHSKSILDIGTGSGIIAMMLAQKSDASVDAVEIDKMAAVTAESNFNNCPWMERLNIYSLSLTDFVKTNSKKFDLIVCNPPFFRNSKLSNDPAKNIAKHNVNLSYEELLFSVSKLLNADGKLCVILPFEQLISFINTCKNNNLKASHITEVIPIINKTPNRVLIQLVNSEKNIDCINDELIIRQDVKSYSTDYLKLTKDFLLKS